MSREPKWKTRDTDDRIGDRLDEMGVRADLHDDEQILDAVVLLRVTDDPTSGQTRLVVASSRSCDAIVQSGLINQARGVVDDMQRED